MYLDHVRGLYGTDAFDIKAIVERDDFAVDLVGVGVGEGRARVAGARR